MEPEHRFNRAMRLTRRRSAEPFGHRIGVVALLSLFFGVPVGHAAAQSTAPATQDTPGLWEADTLTGNWGGLRDSLTDKGVTLGLQEQSEVWGNLAGGLRRGAVYTGLTTASVTFDLEKLAGWTGATVYANAYQIHGRGPSINLVGNLQTVSGLEATRGTKLFDLWLEQAAFDKRLNIRIGQEGANDELMLPKLGALFLNSSFGFPALTAFDLPSGGPNYPLAAPMVRVRYQPIDAFALVAAVFDGDPAGPGPGDPQRRDASGTAFRLQDAALAVLELWYSTGSSGKGGLPGTYKLGGWYHSGRFADELYDTSGRSLADPASSGDAAQHRGNHAIYAVMDQMLWRPNDAADQGLGVFALAMAAPADRNVSDRFVEAGLNWTGPFAGREKDALGLAFAYAHLSNVLRQFGADLIAFTGTGQPYRSNETVLELTYQYGSSTFQMEPDAVSSSVIGAPIR